MFTKRQTLVAKFAAKSEARPEIAGVYVAHDRMAATDSYTLAEVKCTEPIDPANFPIVPNSGTAMTMKEPMILPADFIEKLGAAIPVHAGLPVLEMAAFIGSAPAEETENSKANKTANFITTNLETATVHKTRMIEGTFPKYEGLIPTNKPTASIRLNADYMLKCAKFFADFYKKTGKLPVVTLEFRDQNSPLIMRASALNHDATVLIMPIRQ